MLTNVRLLVASVVCSLAFISQAAADDVSLTLTSCPPWKQEGDEASQQAMLDMCARDSALMTNAIANNLSISSNNQHQLVQEDATPINLYKKLQALREVVQAGDTLYFFQMSHGGILDHTYQGYPVNGEVFAYYTDEEPVDFTATTRNGIWMSARDLRDALSQFAKDTGANVLVIIEACHAAAAGHELIHNPVERLSDDEKIAFIFSAGGEQTSTFTDDGKGARFTEEFALALNQADTGTSLADVFEVARIATHRGAFAYCNGFSDETKDALFQSVDMYFEACLQKPTFFDPKGLLMDIIIQ